MKRWKWMLATAALTVGLTGGALAEEQHWGDRRDPDGAYAQRYNRDWNYHRNYHRTDGYGDRDSLGNWRRERHRDYRDHDQFRRDRDDRGRD